MKTIEPILSCLTSITMVDDLRQVLREKDPEKYAAIPAIVRSFGSEAEERLAALSQYLPSEDLPA